MWRERKRDGVTPPFARAIAIMAAHSITHDRGFHIKPKNLRNLLSCWEFVSNKSVQES